MQNNSFFLSLYMLRDEEENDVLSNRQENMLTKFSNDSVGALINFTRLMHVQSSAHEMDFFMIKFTDL